MKSTFMKVLRVLVLCVVIILYTIGYLFNEHTLVNWSTPVLISLMIAVLTIPFYKMWTWLTTGEDKILNLLCHMICVGALSYASLLAGNYYWVDPASEKQEEVVVQNKYQKTRQKTRRVGRGRYVADETRKEYYLEVVFADGMKKNLHVSLSAYNKTSVGKTKVLALQKGFFGLSVITKGL